MGGVVVHLIRPVALRRIGVIRTLEGATMIFGQGRNGGETEGCREVVDSRDLNVPGGEEAEVTCDGATVLRAPVEAGETRRLVKSGAGH